jgi:large subunit ribosomal protein L4
VFAVTVNEALLHQAVVRQQANARVGTAATKTRANVAGSGAKLFRQKGTGRARQGTKNAPHWIGGGVVFGPHPRCYEKDMPKAMRRLAIKGALSAKVAEQHLVLLDQFDLDAPKTKAMVSVLNNLHITPGSALIVMPEVDQNVVKSARNIPDVKTLPSDSVNVVDLIKYDYIVMPVEAAKKIEQALS